MNNFIFICEDDFREIILQAVILAILYSNNDNNRKDKKNHGIHKSKKNKR